MPLWLILALLALAVFAAFMVWNRRHTDAVKEKHMEASTCGDVPYPGSAPASAVFIGPKMDWAPTYGSQGVPEHPTPHPSGVGWVLRFPRRGQGKIDYVTWRNGPLNAFKRLVVDYEHTIIGGGSLVATPQPPDDAADARSRLQMTGYFQEAGDNFTADDAHEDFRWFGYLPAGNYIEQGAHTMVFDLVDGQWGATQRSTIQNNPAGFAKAKANACCVGIVFGGNGVGIGHGGDWEGGDNDPNSYAEVWVKSLRVE